MNRKRTGVFTISGLLLILCLLTVALMSRPARALPLPPTIAGYPLHSHIFGPDAVQELHRMHDSSFPLTGAAIGLYGQGDAVLWVSETWGSIGARLLEWRMTTTIDRVESPFDPVGERTINGTRVHELTGMGQFHYYFRVGNRLYWLAINAERAEQGLQEVLTFATLSK